jgi:Rrf2 family transcriptional regulator, iron-sulfur cluster assembly transcription factor
VFKLSTRSSYGLRACLALAEDKREAPVAVVELSRENQIPRRYLEQILNVLRHKGLVESTRGARGGYQLAKSSSSITIGEIVRAVEGEMEPILCSVPEMKSGDCRTASGCISRRLCFNLENALMKILDGTTLADLRSEGILARQHNSTSVQLQDLLTVK